MNYAKRIRARATRRCGELLKQFHSNGGRPPETGVAADTSLSQREAAERAGLSKRQQVAAVRVAYVPAEQARHAMRRAVLRLLNDPEWSRWSDREIARRCSVSHEFVRKLRPVDTVNVDSVSPRTFVHPKTGQETTMRTANIGVRPSRRT